MLRPAPVRLVPTFIAGALIALIAACSPAAPVVHTLTVATAGTGAGTVTSSPAGINTAVSGGDDADFQSGTSVTLTATAQAGSTFAGWTGACAGAVGATCDVTMDAAKSAGATFDLLPPVTFALTVTPDGTGVGTVTSSPAGIDTAVVDGDVADFEDGTFVTLTATAGDFSAFSGWTGACAAAVGATCDVTMDAAKSAGATFELLLGTLYFSQDNNANGLFAIDLESGAATLVGSGVTAVTGATVGLAGRGAGEPLVGSTFSQLADVAQDGSAATVFGAVSAEGLTYVATTDLVYAIINGTFRSVSATTGTIVEPLTDPGFDLEGLAADEAGGQIYAIGDDTNLWVYSIVFDTWSVVFDTGVNWDQGGLAYSDAEGILYAIGAGQVDGIYRIDPDAETVTLVGNTGLTGSFGGGLAWAPAD